MSHPELCQRLHLTIAVLLLVVSIGTLGLTGHAKWLLAQSFPAGAWYIWREPDNLHEEQQIRQQWIAVDYLETPDRLALVRAVFGIAAGFLGICVSRVKRRNMVEEEMKNSRSCFQSIAPYTVAVTFAIASFTSTLVSVIWSTILHYQSSKRCRAPTALNEYNTKFTCTRELAACVMLPVITQLDDGVKRQACDKTKTVRWLLAPMLILGLGLVIGYAVQVWSARRRAAWEKRAEGRMHILEKAE